MTDHLDPSLDELLSADLDGETTAEEHDRIEADPDLRARRDELQTASHAVKAPPAPLTASRVDTAVSRALGQSSNVQTLRPPVRRTPPAWLVAAVVVLLGAIGIGLIISAPSSRHADTAEEPDHHPRREQLGERSQCDRHSPRTHPRLHRRFRVAGRVSDAFSAALPNAFRAPGALRAPDLSSGQATRCATVVEARDSRLKPANRRAFAASVAGEPVVVLVYRTQAVAGTRATTRIVAVGAAACDVLVNFEQ